MQRNFQMLADYNSWANKVVYSACSELNDAEFRTDKGAFFGSALGTLNHLLCADRIWLRRITGKGDAPTRLDTILFEDFEGLREARIVEYQRMIALVATLTDEALAANFTYTPITIPEPVTHPVGPTLAHVFNHQTHHRGQVHMILTALGKPSITLDMISFLRDEGKNWMLPV